MSPAKHALLFHDLSEQVSIFLGKTLEKTCSCWSEKHGTAVKNHGFCSVFVEIHWSPQLRDLYENCGLRCQVPALWRRQWPCFCIKQHESWLPKWWIYWCLLRIYPVQTWVSRSFFWSPLKWNLTQDGTVALKTNCACQLDFNVWPWSKFLWCFDFLGIRSHGV